MSLQPRRVFISYARKDDEFREALVIQLAPLQRQRLLYSWDDRRLAPGSDWAQAIDENLETADIIICLISPDYLASENCNAEMQLAMERHAKKEAVVVPVLIRPAAWREAPFARLQVLPKDAKPVTAWTNRDQAWVSVGEGLRKLIEQWPAYVSVSLSPPPGPPGSVTGLPEETRRAHGEPAGQAVQSLLQAFNPEDPAFDLSDEQDPGPSIELVDPLARGLRVRLMAILRNQGTLRLYPPYVEKELLSLGLDSTKAKELTEQWRRDFNLITKARPGRHKPDKGETATDLARLRPEQIAELAKRAKALHEQLARLLLREKKPSAKEAYLEQLRGTGSALRPEQWQPKHQNQGSYLSLAWSPDGRYLAAGYCRSGSEGSDGIEIWEANTWRRCHWLTGHAQGVMTLAFRPDGAMLASGSHDFTIRLWNPHTGQFLRSLFEHREGVLGLCFSPTGDVLISASHDKTLRIWDPKIGDQLDVLRGHRLKVSGLAISADGAYMASCSDGAFDSPTGEIVLWTIKGNTFSPSPLTGGPNSWPNWKAIAFNSTPLIPPWPEPKCSTRLAAAGDDGRIYVWDLATRQLLRVLHGGHTREVTALSFARHPSTLASTSRDNTILVWDTESDRVPPTLGRHDPAAGVMAISVSPDGKRVASAGFDHTIRVWNTGARGHQVVLAQAGQGWVSYVPGQGRYKWGGDLTGKFLLQADGHDLGLDELAALSPALRVPDTDVLSSI